jgi:plastocyanin
MQKLVVAALMVMVSLVACGSDDNTTEATNTTAADTADTAASGAPVALSGKVNDQGTADASGDSQLDMEVGDFSFKPTFIKVTAGQKLTLALKNQGAAPHTFTSTALGVDKELKPGESATVEITVPSADATGFVCRFHQGGGMQGAVFTKEGATAGAGATGTTTAPSNGY